MDIWHHLKLIILTSPDFFPGETDLINALLREGLSCLHVRKPNANKEAFIHFIEQIPKEYRDRITTHDFFELAGPLELGGIHLNRRNTHPPQNYRGRISCSCHSLTEVEERKRQGYTYVFLSPIFDSISKTGYKAAIPFQQLADARLRGIIDRRVIALGGMEEKRWKEVSTLGFGGMALLGDVWNRTPSDIVPHVQRLLRMAGEVTPVILSIAGSDCSGGAGIQADIKTISALGGYAATAITAVTAQNTCGVNKIYGLSPEVVQAQVETILNDMEVEAIKIGMAHDAGVMRAIGRLLRRCEVPHVVCDPVMISTSGCSLMQPEARNILCEEVLPHCTLITPNLNEASWFLGAPVSSLEEMEHAARTLAERWDASVLIKGGHLESNDMCDILWHDKQPTRLTATRIRSRNLHGTGCTLSSAIATLLARGLNPACAVAEAKKYLTQAVHTGSYLTIGKGNGPLRHFFSTED